MILYLCWEYYHKKGIYSPIIFNSCALFMYVCTFSSDCKQILIRLHLSELCLPIALKSSTEIEGIAVLNKYASARWSNTILSFVVHFSTRPYNGYNYYISCYWYWVGPLEYSWSKSPLQAKKRQVNNLEWRSEWEQRHLLALGWEINTRQRHEDAEGNCIKGSRAALVYHHGRH